MSVRKENFLDFLQDNANKNLSKPIELWTQEIIEGNFTNLPENPFEMEWQVFAYLINGYRLSEILGIGDKLEFVNYWLKR